MVELLLRQGARPDPQDRRKNTPLHLAVCTSRWAVTQKLLAAGASVWSTNGANMSALQLARGKLNMVLRLKVKGTLDFDKHIEELRAVSAWDRGRWVVVLYGIFHHSLTRKGWNHVFSSRKNKYVCSFLRKLLTL